MCENLISFEALIRGLGPGVVVICIESWHVGRTENVHGKGIGRNIREH
jgi:hypothetical protein